MARRLGTMLIEEGYLSAAQVEAALALQQRYRHASFGQILVDLGIINADELQAKLQQHHDFLAKAEVPRPDFATFLQRQRLLEPHHLAKAEAEQQRRQRLRLGELLMDMGFLSQTRLDAIIEQQLFEMTIALP